MEPVRMRLPFAKKDIIRFLVVRILPMNVVRIENVGPGPAVVVHRFVGRVIIESRGYKGRIYRICPPPPGGSNPARRDTYTNRLAAKNEISLARSRCTNR